ncbi:MAG: D-2-hydroxyacid dehydrogenase [Bryobacterales bacterium]|nr:D-2-hydroxyacid dehydrogenase [Bryobacteraceae bacterium]MDW8130955.1 D-2-hydroxyacid dehydrogenase [Bryobacterales bacterium]
MSALTVLVLADPHEPELALLERLPDDTRIAVGNSPEAFRSAAADAEIVLSWFAPRELLEATWRMAPRLRWVHSASAGVENVLFAELIESDVPVTNGRGLFSDSLAEFVIGAVLFFAKDFRRMLENQRAGRWEPFDVELIEAKWLGILGYGDIGRAIARRGRALGMKIAGLRRRVEAGASDPLLDRLLGPDQLDELLALSDYLAIALPLTETTRGLLGEGELARLKPGAVIVNVGRGAVIVEDALVRALRERRIRGAALDVFEREPLPENHPFYALDNVLLSPHCADHFPGWKRRAMELFLENFERFRRGLPLRNLVDKRSGY